jgi:hypothetical protein
MNYYKCAVIAAAFAITAGTMPVMASAPYTDIGSGPARAAVDYLYDTHCLSFIQTGDFKPAQALTRGELASLLYGAMVNFQQNNPWSQTSQTVLPIGRDAVKVLAENGILKGYPDGSFRSNEVVTRETFAVAVYHALNYFQMGSSDGAVKPYSDEGKISSWALPAVQVLQSKNLFPAAAEFQPQRVVTRAEAADMVYHLIKADDTYVSHVAIQTGVLKSITAEFGSPVEFFTKGTMYWQGDKMVIAMKGGAGKLFQSRLKEDVHPYSALVFKTTKYGRDDYDLAINRAVRCLVRHEGVENYVGAEPDYANEQIVLTVRHPAGETLQSELDKVVGAGFAKVVVLPQGTTRPTTADTNKI